MRGTLTPAPGASQPGDNVVLGALHAWRYGWAVAVIVRVDYCGEVYARRTDDHEVVGARALRPLSDDEEEEAAAEDERRRHTRSQAQRGPAHHVGHTDRHRRPPGR